MGRVLILVLALLVPQVAAARMYMCIDEATGATSFTDKACETEGAQKEIKVEDVNSLSGSNPYRGKKVKAWRSQTDVRKTGSDINAQRRSLYESKASASTH